MKCPKCRGSYLKVFGSYSSSWQKIQFHADGDLDVINDNPGDFSWEDDDVVACLDCNYEGTAKEFTEPEEPEPVRPADRQGHDAWGDHGLMVDAQTLAEQGPVIASIEAAETNPRFIVASLEGIRIMVTPTMAQREIMDYSLNQWRQESTTVLPCSLDHAKWLTRGMNELDRSFALNAMKIKG